MICFLLLFCGALDRCSPPLPVVVAIGLLIGTTCAFGRRQFPSSSSSSLVAHRLAFARVVPTLASPLPRPSTPPFPDRIHRGEHGRFAVSHQWYKLDGFWSDLSFAYRYFTSPTAIGFSSSPDSPAVAASYLRDAAALWKQPAHPADAGNPKHSRIDW